ncbi:hypothetical protein [Collimonas sp.]|jgi:hypothetical protein|uniref:hypothetical protein n=1 Tax=Collimonas sp. TaxID=1963772 RepID=UPI002C0DDD9E|nr:hypothetical protein [Collimonas sp.]HWW04169.1 hypothetical protein [Collimonas sp.]
MTTDHSADSTAAADQGNQASGPAAASPELTGGAGFTFEDGVAAVYAAALLTETTAPGLPGRQVRCLSVQQGPLGQPLDDVIVQGTGVDGISMRLSLQVKRKLVISGASSNSDFRDAVLRAHATVVGSGFNVGLDRVGVVTGEISDASKRDFETLCEWARADGDATGFLNKLRTEGVAGEKQTHFDIVRNILSGSLPEAELDAATHTMLSHFVLMRFEMLHEGSVTEAQTVTNLANHLHPSERLRVDDLWRRLLALVRVSEGHAASFDRKTLVARLNGAFRLSGAPSMQTALSRIGEEARLTVAEIGNDINGVSIPRARFVQSSRTALTQHRFVQIGGLPGTGKSVVLRTLVEEALLSGPVLFLKGDRLTGTTWPQYATASGVGTTPLEDLLVELAATGSPTVFVDGLDRIEVQYHGILKDIFNTIIDSPLLSNWRVVASVRDTGIEPMRTWLPNRLLVDGAAVIDVTEFDDAEAAVLATSKPALAPLLFGTEQVKTIVRRPFFAGVLSRRSTSDTSVPSSEIELSTAWWTGGGYGADASRAGYRRNALIELARSGATTLGKRISVLGIDPQALVELETDGIIRQVRTGHSVEFVHDIYFEWAFLQLLVSQGELWLDVIRQVGEPPVLGRVVELLSQSELKEGTDWQKHLERLEGATDIRSQWLRAWMVGPFGLPSFPSYEATYNTAMLAGDAKRVGKLVVWFQAEKTKANPNVLGRVLPDLDLVQRILLADSMAWPSDLPTWRRFCSWLIRRNGDVPATIRPDIVAVFEVWQNAAADLVNPVSGAIIELAKLWLMNIGTLSNGLEFRRGELEELILRLRALLLRAGRAYPTPVRELLSHLMAMEHMPRNAIKQVMTYAPIISEVCPNELTGFALRVMIRPLPEEVARNLSRTFGTGISSHDWQSLSIDDQHGFFPSAPTREPFASLFAHAPDEARRLVRQLANHAITAWRQLHIYDYQERGTPISLTLNFPWGQQTFWGGAQQYVWSRGTWGSHVVGSGLMALEAWAFKEVEKGRPVDDVVRDVLDGHEGVAAIGVAVAVMLENKHCSMTTLPLLTSQRLWEWDIQRNMSDLSLTESLIGFQSNDRRHYDAVVESNKRGGRQLDVRWLASVCVIGGGELGALASAVIVKFADDLPFDYVEQRENPGTVEHLRRTAEIWAEMGRNANYRATPTGDGESVIIQLDNPKAQGPDIDAINQRQAEMNEHLTLLNFAERCFKRGASGDSLTFEQVIERARRLDESTLFENAFEHASSNNQRQGAVASVAAVALRYGRELPSTDIEWAVDVCLRAWKTPESQDELFFSGSILIYHPVLYASRGLATLVRRDPARRDAVEALMRLAAHPYEQIVIEALGGLMELWDLLPEVAWNALVLAISLSIVERFSYDDVTTGQREEQARRRVNDTVGAALIRNNNLEESPQPLPGIPPAWVAVANGPIFKTGRRGNGILIEWEHSPIDLQCHLLAKVLTRIPVPTVMADEPQRDAFLSWCDGLVEWTIERLCPSWSRVPGQEPFDSGASNLYEWQRELYRFLAQVSLHLEPEEGFRRFIEPATRADDETFGSLAESYVTFLTYIIMDEPVLPPTPLALLELIVPRLLAHEGWERAKWNDGELHNAELSRMIRVLFFVDVEKAMGAARFANGDWNDISSIHRVVDPILAAQGQNPSVTSAYLTMCERAVQSYPLERFVAQLPMVFGGGDGTPIGWRGTSMSARLAGLIQQFSEKTQPLSAGAARTLLRALDALVDMGDRRAAAIQTSEVFKDVRTAGVVA